MQEDYENVTNEAAEQGTRVHDLLHRLLTSKPLPEKVDREELERAKYAFGLIKELVDKYVYHGEDLGKFVRVYSEQKVYLSKYVNDELRGTLDVVIAVGKINIHCPELEYTDIFVIDYKDGNVPVEIKNNKQLEYYAAAFDDDDGLSICDTEYRIGIIQPRVAQGIQWDEPRDNEYIKKVAEKIKEEVDICETRPFTKAGEWCKYCLASGSCKANAERLMELVGVDINV
jgi:hypothetical protein